MSESVVMADVWKHEQCILLSCLFILNRDMSITPGAVISLKSKKTK